MSGFCALVLTLIAPLLALQYYRLLEHTELKAHTDRVENLIIQIFTRPYSGKIVTISLPSYSLSLFTDSQERALCFERIVGSTTEKATSFLEWNKPIALQFTSFFLLQDDSPLSFSQGGCAIRDPISYNSLVEDFGEIAIDSSELEQFTPTLAPIPSSRCKAKKNFDCVACFSGFYLESHCGSRALALDSKSEFRAPLNFPSQQWGIQFFFQIDSTAGTQYSDVTLLSIKGTSGQQLTLQASYDGIQYYPAGIQITFQFDQTPHLNSIEIPHGTWLFCSISASSDQIVLTTRDASLSTTNSFVQTVQQLSINHEESLIVLSIRELRIIDGYPSPSSAFNSCRLHLSSPSGLLFYFPLDINSQSSSSILDSLSSTPATFINSEGKTPAELIVDFQPLTHFNPPECLGCLSSCNACTDLLECSACRVGKLNNGICLTASLEPTRGFTGVTHFSVRSVLLQLESLNAQISERLGESKTWLRMHSWNVKMIYPKQYDLNEHSEFLVMTISEMANVEEAKVTAILQINGKQPTQVNFSITLEKPTYVNFPSIVESVSLQTLMNNECGCSEKGTCSQEFNCDCESGFTGQRCTLTERDFLLLETTLTTLVEEMKNLPLSASQVFERIQSLSYSPELLSLESKQYFLSQIQTHTSTFNKAQALILISKIAPDIRIQEQVTYTISKVTQFLRDELTNSTLRLSSPNIDISASLHPANETLKTTYVLIQADTVPLAQSFIIQEIHFKYQKYQAPAHHTFASTVLSIRLYDGAARGLQLKIKDLTPGIHLSLPLNQKNRALQKQIALIYADPEKVLEVMSQAPLSCSFWDSEQSILSNSGCSFLSVNFEAVQCYCDHLTDFMSFLEKGSEVMDKSNYSVFSALTKMRPDDLLHNLAMQVAVIFWILYLLLAVLVVKVDRTKLKRNFFKKLFELIHERPANSEQDSERRWPVRYDGEKSSRRAVTRVSTFRLATLRVVPQRTESCSTPKTLVLNDFDSFQDNKSKKRKTVWKKVKDKLSAHLERAKDEKRCCCVIIGRVTADELESNNLPFNLFKTTSPLMPRLIRLSLFSFTLLSQLAICAFFSELDDSSQDSESPFFWEGMFENLWIALYSVLITMIPMTIVGCLLAIPKSVKRRLQVTTSLKQIEQSYNLHKKRVLCRLIIGLFFFFILSNFFLLYMICFCHLASSDVASEWAHSSILSVVIDQLIFEVAPAFLVGLVVMASGASKCCRSSIGVAVLVEIYRSYRNLTDP